MQYRDLGSTGLKVPLLGLGTGGPSALGQSSNKTQAEQYTLVWRCLDLGVNLFDTAPIYRRSEEILGHALRGVPRDSRGRDQVGPPHRWRCVKGHGGP